MVADINTDMFLPLFPLQSLVVQGLDESDLGDDIRDGRAADGDRGAARIPSRSAMRFIAQRPVQLHPEGVPSISMKVGFEQGSPEHEMVEAMAHERYHAPSDDLAQPIDRQAAEDFNRVYVAALEAVANRPTRPAWNSDSFFRRFAKK